MARHPHAPAGSTPFVVDVARLGRRPGSMMSLRDRVTSPSRIGLDLIAIAAGTTVEMDLRLESVSEGILVTGTVAAPTAGECARCLAPVTGRVEVELIELFAYPHSATEATTDEDEVGRVVDDTVNIEQAIVDAVGLTLPLSPLCRPDCPGLCPQCGVALAAAEPGHHHEQIDPRWAKLGSMFQPARPGNGER